MGLSDLNGVLPQGIDYRQVLLEHVRVLVILAGYVLLDGSRECEGRGLAKGQAEKVAGRGFSMLHALVYNECGRSRWGINRLGKALTWPWFL